MLASVVRADNGVAGAPAKVVVMEEPAVTAAESLPPEFSAVRDFVLTAPVTKMSGTVLGGGDFSDAATLLPGTYNELILPGEQLFYKIRLGFGQSAAMTVDVPAPGTAVPEFRGADQAMFDMNAYNAARAELLHAGSKPSSRAPLNSAQPTVVDEVIPEVRYLNRESGSGVAPASIPGFYYFSLAREVENVDSTANVPLSVRVQVGVNGEPRGEPAYAGTAPDASASPSASPPPPPWTSHPPRARPTPSPPPTTVRAGLSGSGWSNGDPRRVGRGIHAPSHATQPRKATHATSVRMAG